MKHTRHATVLALSLTAASSGCAFYFEFGGSNETPATTSTTRVGDPSASARGVPPTQSATDAGAPTQDNSAWTRIAAPVAASERVAVVGMGRDVLVSGTREVVRVVTERDRVERASAAAQALAGSVALVATPRGEVYGWSPLALVRYESQGDRTVMLSRMGTLESFVDPLVVWTGSSLLVWGGGSALGRTSEGAIYSPIAESWAPLALERAPSGRTRAAGVWTGSQLVVFGGSAPGDVLLGDGASYAPSVTRWLAIEARGAPSARASHTAVWTGDTMLVWGGRSANGALADGAAWHGASGTWQSVGTRGAPSARSGHVAVWTGSRMIVWGGTNGTTTLSDGGVYDPTTRQWTPIPSAGDAVARHSSRAVWTGRELVIVGGVRGSERVGDVLVYRPAAL